MIAKASKLAPLLAMLVAPLLLADGTTAPELGTWLTQNGKAVVAITPCGQGLCGRLVGLTLAKPGAVVRDVWGRSECNETIVRMRRLGANGHWHGTVTDPRNGASYAAELWRTGNTLHLRGFVLLPALGSTQDWQIFHGKIGAHCAFQP